jgi:hypothetical protein
MKRTVPLIKHKRYHSSSSSSREDEEHATYHAKSNPCIKRLLSNMPSYNSLDEDDDMSSITSLGLKTTEDHFVIDGIRKKKGPFPREDGYEIEGVEEHRNAKKQPFGKKYYEDQLDRLQLMSDSNEYTMIKLIAGFMSRSPYDLFDEEDMNRLQQEREEQKLTTQLELKRRIESTDQKERQLKAIEEKISNLRALKESESKSVTISSDDILDVEELLGIVGRSVDDILTDLCDIDDNKHYSYTNILGLLTLFDVGELTFKDTTGIIGLIDDDEENDNPLLEPFKGFSSEGMNEEALRNVYLFVIYCLYNGNYTSFEIFQSLLIDTIVKFGDPLNANSLIKSINKKPQSLETSCTLFISVDLESLFTEESALKMALEACDNELGSNSVSMKAFLNGDANYSISNDPNAPSDLKEYLPNVNTITEKRKMVKRYFIHKWLETASWKLIGGYLRPNWVDKPTQFAYNTLQLIKQLKREVFDVYIRGRRTIIIDQLQKVIKRDLSKAFDDMDACDIAYRNHNFYNDISNSKFKKYLATSEYTKDYKPVLVNSAIHRLLDLYLRYVRFVNENIDQISVTISELEQARNKTRKNLLSLSTEEDGGGGDASKPGYKQRKSFTSQPSISGIVRLKEEVTSFINSAYLLVQQYCKDLNGLPLEAFHSPSAIEVGLTCDFAKFIAREIANNRVIFEETYKSKHHNEKVTIARADAMNALKKYRGSNQYGEYVISVKESQSYQRRGLSNSNPNCGFYGDDGILFI